MNFSYTYYIPFIFYAIAIIGGYFAIKSYLSILKEYKKNKGLK